ncbi:MAG TPA: hypothetical protein VM142_11245 [Acidimicrobiales bacterium]|nr:hypothetical protein [Acidimicrobiales bacterium]
MTHADSTVRRDHAAIWDFASRANASMASMWDPVVERAVADLGVDRTTLVMLSFLLAKEPHAMSLADFAQLSAYSAPTFFTERLARATGVGHSSHEPSVGWRLTTPGRQRMMRLHADIATAIAGADPLAPSDSSRLAEHLQVLVDASLATPAPPTPRMSWYMHRLIVAGDAPLARVVRALVCLDAYRSDAHQDAWRASGLSATAIEVLTALWRRPGSLAQVCEQLAVRGHPYEVYAVALGDLRRRDLVVGSDEVLELTSAGTELRSELEVSTDRLFFAPWECIGAEAGAELDGLLRLLNFEGL